MTTTAWYAALAVAEQAAAPLLAPDRIASSPLCLPEAVVLLAAALHHLAAAGTPLAAVSPAAVQAVLATPASARAVLHAAPAGRGVEEQRAGLAAPTAEWAQIRAVAAGLLR